MPRHVRSQRLKPGDQSLSLRLRKSGQHTLEWCRSLLKAVFHNPLLAPCNGLHPAGGFLTGQRSA
jgi:hypothetical protein